MGAEAFEELSEVVEKLADAGEGMGWAKNVQNQLRAAKRYLKCDFKVQLERYLVSNFPSR